MTLEREDEQGGRQDEHDERDEDPQVVEQSQVDHIGLGEVFFLSGVGEGDRNGTVTENSVEAIGEEHTVAQGG